MERFETVDQALGDAVKGSLKLRLRNIEPEQLEKIAAGVTALVRDTIALVARSGDPERTTRQLRGEEVPTVSGCGCGGDCGCGRIEDDGRGR